MFRRSRLEKQTMKIFTREEGGYHHCQIDNQSICSSYMWDWLEKGRFHCIKRISFRTR
jgi:hypothetical protein